MLPQVGLRMVERSRMRIVAALRNGAIDIVIATDAGPLFESKALPLWSERILVALPEGHQLATKKSIYWTDLRNETVLLSQYDPGRELEDLLMAKLVSTADRPKIERHDVSRGIIKTLITIGLGVSLVAESDIGVTFAGLTYREVRDGTGPILRSAQRTAAAHRDARPSTGPAHTADSGIMWARLSVEIGGCRTLA